MRAPRAARCLALSTMAMAGIATSLSLRGSAVAADLDGETVAAITEYVTRQLEALDVPGAAVAIVHDDAIVYSAGFGDANADGRDVTAQTPFHLASVSKSLTAIAVMQQVERGGLELDERVTAYLPWFDDAHPSLGPVAVRELLGHLSGWSEGDGRINLADASEGDDAIELNVRRLAATRPSGTHGTFEYSNANYDVLAHLVELSSGMSFAAYLETEVFGPLAMSHAHATHEAARADGLAAGFLPFFGIRIPYDIPYVGGSAGSSFLYASAEDLANTLIFHLNDGRLGETTVLGANGVADLHRPVSYPNADGGYAGGLHVYPLFSAGGLERERDTPVYRVPMTLQHEGDMPTTATGILIMPAERWGVVVLMNTSDAAAPSRFHQMPYGIASILLGKEPPETVAYEDALLQYLRPILGGVIGLQVIGVALATRRLRRWHEYPRTAPTTQAARLGHLIPPLVPDIGVPAAFWWMVIDRGNAPLAVVITSAPDIALCLVAITGFGIAWGLVRTVATLRVLRASARKRAEVAPVPA